MSRRRHLSRALLALTVTLGGAAPAAAQTLTLAPTVTRTKSARDSSREPLWMSYKDCTSDDAYQFTVSVMNYQGYALEVWAGSSVDCGAYDKRHGTSPQCWPVYAPSTPTASTFSLLVRVQDIIAQRKGGDIAASPGTSADCDAYSGPTTPQSLSLYFFLLNGSGEAPAGFTPAVYTAAKYDLLGPVPPTNVKAGAGEGALIVRFDGSTDNDRQGYRFYCDRTTLEGADGGGCASAALVPGELPDESYYCGSVTGALSSRGEVSGLENQARYAVAVAGVDTVGNVGKLSALACGSPQEVTDFFEEYRAAGGEAGGGFCSLGARGGQGASALLLGALLALGLRRRSA